MRFERACEILGVEPGDSQEEIKRKYRKLAAELHPDAGKYKNQETSLHITEVNAAYEFLIKQGEYRKNQGKAAEVPRKPLAKREETWDAEKNPGAFIERDIYQYAEDQDGEAIGIYRIARGKYFWNPDAEDFRLFLKSIIAAVDGLIGTLEEEMGEPFREIAGFQARKELIYLLAGQYTDLERGLEAFAKEERRDSAGNRIFSMPAMMELLKPAGLRKNRIEEGEHLYPLQMRDHRLYLGRKNGENLGYLSFADDRIYYILIPMFENREVQVKIETTGEARRNNRGSSFVPLHLWVRKIQKDFGVQESINARIEGILQELKKTVDRK